MNADSKPPHQEADSAKPNPQDPFLAGEAILERVRALAQELAAKVRELLQESRLDFPDFLNDPPDRPPLE